NGLIIYDISKPARPVRLSRFRPGRCSTWDVAVQGRTAYLANGKQGIWVLDTSRAGNVRVLDRINIGGELRELELKENLLYAAAAPAGVQVFDVCHPDHPRLADLVPTAGTPHALHFVGEFGFIADCSFGLSVFNLPSAEVVGHAYSAGSASDVAVAGRYLYLANGADGLRIYQWHGQGASLTGARSGVRDFVLRATVAPGQTYTVQASSDLEAWVDIGEVTADAEGCCEYVDPLAGTASSRFYKLKLP
ncbi:MAG TPA: hypothetical protein VN673_06825, partial [Clostridia bacterium]|nr:hypothetical protein [Clostridia bacterium]